MRPTEVQMKFIVLEFESARTHLTLNFALKISHWPGMPFSRFAMRHRNPIKAAVATHAVLRNLTESDPEDSALRWLFCLVSPLFTWSVEEGGEWDPLSSPEHRRSLRIDLCTLRITRFAERYMEGQHSKTRRGVSRSHRHNEAYVNQEHGWPEIQTHGLSSPQAFAEFDADIDIMASDKVRVKHHGFANRQALIP